MGAWKTFNALFEFTRLEHNIGFLHTVFVCMWRFSVWYAHVYLSMYVRMYICIVLTIVYTQELKSAREFLSLLNSHLSRAVSLLLFIFLTSSVQGTHSHCTDRAFES